VGDVGLRIHLECSRKGELKCRTNLSLSVLFGGRFAHVKLCKAYPRLKDLFPICKYKK